jgi:hypothetical protein
MVTKTLKYRIWGRWEMLFAFFLFALLISELLVILIINTGSGVVLAHFFAPVGKGIAQTLSGLWKWIYRMIGPMVFPLFILNIVEIWSVCRLFACSRAGIEGNTPDTQYKILRIVEGVAPGFGFLGTCISLIFTMYNMDPGMTQSVMLKELLQNSSSAFGSTVYGIALAISAFLSHEIFKGFLIREETGISCKIGVHGAPAENESMNLLRREA